MSRDFRNLRVFTAADQLVIDIYGYSGSFPDNERYGMQSQLRRAAVSIPCNIVEGSARTTTSEYIRFLEIALSSARECQYLSDLSGRLKLGAVDAGRALAARFAGLQAGLTAQIRALLEREKSSKAETHRRGPGGRSLNKRL
jgi:four helix bundle protein